MEKHTELTQTLKTHADNILARTKVIQARLNELTTLPRAHATIWEREGKTGTTYYLVHKQGSPRFQHDTSRRERIGRGKDAKLECEKQIQHQQEYQRLTNEQATLSKQYNDLIYSLREAINALGKDQPDGELFFKRYRYS